MDLARIRLELREYRLEASDLELQIILNNIRIKRERPGYLYWVSQRILIKRRLQFVKNMIKTLKNELLLLSRI